MEIKKKYLIKEGYNPTDVDFVFKSNPELAKIGTKEEYSQYLDTIFPTSKVKDIVFHRTKSKVPFEKFDLSFAKDFGDYGKAFYFAPLEKVENVWNANALKNPTNNILAVKLNINNPFIDPKDRDSKDFQDFIRKNKNYGVTAYVELYNDGVIDYYEHSTPLQYAIYDSNNIHILGSKKDIEGFKNFVSNNTEIIKEDIENQTMVFWHGGDLSDIDNTFRQQTKKQEYGPGLYLTTSYNVVKDYVKGSRKLYRVEVSLGNSLEDAEIPYERVMEFLNKLPKQVSIKIKSSLDKYNRDGFINAEIINNLFVNYNLLKPEISYKLKQFYLENNIDYSLVNNAFGWGEDMMILFNTNKIINVERIGPKDKIDKFELHKEEMEVSKKDLIQNWLNNPKKLKEDAEDANFMEEITKAELEEAKKKKGDRCLKIARRKMPQTSAYRSGLIVQCRRGKIWKGLNEDEGENIDDKYFNGMLITNDFVKGDKPIWQPLYEFLKSIFGEKYKQAADGYMFYASYIIEDFNNLEVFQYRHGITRKYFYLDSEGQPYKIDFSYSNLKKDNYVSGVKKIPYQEQFKLIYSDLIKYIESACKTNDCVVPDDSYLMKYSDYKILRDKALNKFGYNVQTIKSKKDMEDFGKELNEDEYLLEPKRPKPKTTLDLGISTDEGKGVDNIIAVYNEADDEEKDYWGKWYNHANKDVNTLSNKFNIDFRIAAAVVAVLSPGNKWLGNLYAAEKVIQKFNDPLLDIKINAYGRNIDKALKILETGDISYVKGPKVTVFFNSLMDPQSVDKELVLDSHAINIWFGIKRNLKETPNISNKLRKRVLDDYRKASEILGVSLQSLQAVTWYVWKYTKKPPKQLPHTNIKVKKSNKKTTELPLDEKWSEKYKRSIDCNNPKGFSQKAHCKGRLKEEEQSMGKRKIYVLVGPPSVGKSTWIKNTFGDIQPYVISRDDIVEQVADNLGWTYDDLFVAPPQGSQLGDYDEKYGEVIQSPSYMSWQPLSFSKVLEANNQVHVTFTKRVSNAVSSGKDIVVDMTNMTAGARKNALKAIEGSENLFEKIAVVFPFQGAEDVIIDVARKRAEAAKRMGKSKTLPDSVMRKMFASFQDVSPEEGFDKVVQQDNRELLSTLNEKTDFSKEKSKGLHGWFERQGGSGKSKGWVDCNTCRTVDGKKKCKTCGRQEGEKRAKYPACRPTPSACGSKGKGKSWGKKSANEDVLNEETKQDIEKELKLNEIKSLFKRHIGKL